MQNPEKKLTPTLLEKKKHHISIIQTEEHLQAPIIHIIVKVLHESCFEKLHYLKSYNSCGIERVHSRRLFA